MSNVEIVYRCGCVSDNQKKSKCLIHNKGIIAVSGSVIPVKEFDVVKLKDGVWISNSNKLSYKSIAKSFDIVLGKPSLPIEVESPNFIQLSELKGKKVAYLGCRNIRILSYIMENCPKVLIDSKWNIVSRVIKDPDLAISMGIRKRK